jgi:signal transduction histidine kinase
VDLNMAVQEAVALVRNATLLEGLSIKMELDPGLPIVQADRVQLQQVVLNLLLNAIAAMRDTPPAARELVVTTAIRDSRAAMVSVVDSGTGIDEDKVERLFQPFYTTKSDGLGMGLSISRTIINAHGGTIGAENNPERGATFRFTLPLDQGARI